MKIEILLFMQSIRNHHTPTTPGRIISTSSKHWAAYLFPLFIILLGILFIFPFGIILILFGFYMLLNIKSKKWILTENELIISSGFFPWHKSYLEIPIEDLFDAYYVHGFWATLFGFGLIKVRRTDGVTTTFQDNNMKNHKDIIQQTNVLIKSVKKPKISTYENFSMTPSSVSDELLKLSALLEKGVLTTDEFYEQKAKLLRIG